ncbi:MAG: cysteinyl-tRNA synthetase [Candidatus Azotimanducaceae bacterium]|jgi:cysteinyl-tRNA synthetase
MFKLFSIPESKPAMELPPLSLFNTESKALEVFEPLKKNKVTMYTCGPTVYDFAHIGNLRAYVFADILKRTLEYNGYEVKHTMNFTDFGHLTSDADSGEDKIMKGLKREGLDISLEAMRQLSNRYISAFKEDTAAMNIVEPTQYARASDFVTEQIALIASLSEKGYTYETSDGLYFDISKFATYGRLGSIQLDDQKDGARVDVNTEKRHPADFAVWKKGELGWDSAWGKGFPGWHIECSAMAFSTLGKQIDIHTGGVDNIATHHNGEIAQSESASGKQFVKYWLHSEHIQIDNEKIAKSDGNGISLRDLFHQGFSGSDYRYWLLTSHYRTQTNFTLEALSGSKQALSRLKRFMYEECTDTSGKIEYDYRQKFIEAINDDLDTPKAVALIWELMKDDSVAPEDKRMTIVEMDAVLGIGLDKNHEIGARELGHLEADDIPEEIQTLIDSREAARITRNWPEADKVRDTLQLKGYTIEDTPEGPRVTKS